MYGSPSTPCSRPTSDSTDTGPIAIPKLRTLQEGQPPLALSFPHYLRSKSSKRAWIFPASLSLNERVTTVPSFAIGMFGSC